MNLVRKTAGDSSLSDLDVVIQKMRDKLGSQYMVMCLRNMQPVAMGFPIARPRLYIIGVRKPCNMAEGEGNRAVQNLLHTIQQEGSVPLTYPVFLNMETGLKWDRLGSLPNAEELQTLKRCGCSLNPFSVCQVHPCKCSKCSHGSRNSTVPDQEPNSVDSTVSAEDKATGNVHCTWRKHAAHYIANQLPNMRVANHDGKLTYVEILEMNGLAAPMSARERNLLNLVAHHPKTGQLNYSLAILDLSQGIDRLTLMTNGIVPTLVTNSRPWSMRHGRTLTVGELMALSGLPPTADMEGQSEASARSMVGNAMHVAGVGLATSAALFLAMGLLA